MVKSLTQAPPEIKAAAFAALAKLEEKCGDRDALPGGASHTVALQIVATVDGQPAGELSAACNLAVGFPQQRAGSAPPADDLLAYVLGKLNRATQEAVLRNLAADYAADGGRLPVDDTLADRAKQVLKAARATQQTTARGAVSVQITIE